MPPRQAPGQRDAGKGVRSPGPSRAQGADPVGDIEKDRIRVMHARGMSLGAIAKELGRSRATISKHAKAMGLGFDREQTRAATQAKVADCAARRAETSRRFLEKAGELLDMMDQPFIAFNFGGRDNTYEQHEFDKPPAEALHTLMRAAAQAFDKHMAQDRHDSDDGGLNAVDAWLRGMLGEAG